MNKIRDKFKKQTEKAFITYSLWPEQLNWLQSKASVEDRTVSYITREAIKKLIEISNESDSFEKFSELKDRTRKSIKGENIDLTSSWVDEDMLDDLEELINTYDFPNRSYAIRIGIELLMSEPVNLPLNSKTR